MGTLAEQAKKRFKKKLEDDATEAVYHQAGRFEHAVETTLGEPGSVSSVESGWDVWDEPRLVRWARVQLTSEDEFLVKIVTMPDEEERAQIFVFEQDSTNDKKVVLFGPPVTSLLSYGEALVNRVPFSEWEAENQHVLDKERTVQIVG